MKNDKFDYKAIWVKPALHQTIKVAALLKEKTMNDYLFYLLENEKHNKSKRNTTKKSSKILARGDSEEGW